MTDVLVGVGVVGVMSGVVVGCVAVTVCCVVVV